MKKVIGIAVLVVAFSLSIKIQAQTATPRITQKQVNQEARIQEGKRSGELTRREKRHLQMQQAKIQNDKQIAKSDGVVTGPERRHIKREQRRANKNIYRQKNDGQRRG